MEKPGYILNYKYMTNVFERIYHAPEVNVNAMYYIGETSYWSIEAYYPEFTRHRLTAKFWNVGLAIREF